MKYTKTILKNGVRVVTVPMTGNPTVTVLVGVGTGAYNETPEQSGISHFLEHMCFKGTAKRPTPQVIAMELDNIGAAYNAFTTSELTAYYAKADTKHFKKIGEVVADVYLNSIFPEAEIKKEKGVVLGEIDMYVDDNQQKVADAIRIHMYKGEPAERYTIGTKETVTAITREHLLAYRNSQYKASNTIVTIAGGVDEAAAIAWAESAFGAVEDGPIVPEFSTKDRIQNGPEEVYVDKESDQAHIIMSWRSFNRSSPDRFIARFIAALLRSGMSSRLFNKLREELGAGYYISAGQDTSNSFGDFSVSTGTTHARVAEIVAAIKGEMQRLKTEDVLDPELEKIREMSRAQRLMGLETSEAAAEFFGIQEIESGTIRTPEELDEIFSKVSAADIKRVANAIFVDDKLTFAVIGKGIDKAAVSKALAS